MVRLIAGVVVGYIAILIFVFATFSLAYVAMGADGAFRPGTYEVTMLWIVVSFVLSFAAAVVGGCVCAQITRHPKGPLSLAIIVLVLGIVMAVPTLNSPVEEMPRTEDVGNMEAMQSAKQPPWVSFLNPFIGAVGVMIGGRRHGAEVSD